MTQEEWKVLEQLIELHNTVSRETRIKAQLDSLIHNIGWDNEIPNLSYNVSRETWCLA